MTYFLENFQAEEGKRTFSGEVHRYLVLEIFHLDARFMVVNINFVLCFMTHYALRNCLKITALLTEP